MYLTLNNLWATNMASSFETDVTSNVLENQTTEAIK